MSRKHDRTKMVNEKAAEILQDPMTLFYLASKIIRKKPKLMPSFVWKLLMLIVLAPAAKEKHEIERS